MFTKLAIVILLAAIVLTPSCITTKGDAWRFDSAETPEGWPESSPVGEVALREYPTYREAKVTRASAASGDEQDALFMQLFRHIDRNEIAMTAPVEMVYDEGRVESMAFVYRDLTVGQPGTDGAVAVRDVAPELFASTGVRGRYGDDNFGVGREIVEAWLAENAGKYQRVGPYRYLGYNGPFTLPFLRYGEVQVRIAASR
ncbi:MAG: hypothetical protein ACI9EF_003254 [Pseudohongiellaceae bacterium]|jgi:hypothetical protein